MGQVQALALVARQHKCAHAMPGFHQPGRLQFRQCLAHDRAADAVLADDGGFGGQPLARQHLAKQDALGQRGDDVMGQALGALARGVVEHRSFHAWDSANTNTLDRHQLV